MPSEIIPANFVDQESVIPANFVDTTDVVPANFVDSAEEKTSSPLDPANVLDYKKRADYTKGFLTAGVKTILGGTTAFGQIAQKAVNDPLRVIGSKFGITSPPDTSIEAWRQAADRGMQAPENNIPILHSTEPGAIQFDQDFEHLMEYLRTKSDAFAQWAPGIKQLYALNPNLGYTLATIAPDVLLTLSMAIGMGKPGVKEAVTETKGVDGAKAIADSIKQRKKTKPTETLGIGSQMEFPGMGEEQMQRAPQFGSQEAGGFRSIDENGHPFDSTRTQEMADTLGGDPLGNFKGPAEENLRQDIRNASTEDLLKQAEIESVQRSRETDPIRLLEDKKLQEEISWAQHEAEQRKTSYQRQIEQANLSDTSVKEALKKSIDIEGDYTSLLFTFGSKEMRPEFLDRVLRGIKSMPEDQLNRIKSSLEKEVENFEDNSPRSRKAWEQYIKVEGELKSRENTRKMEILNSSKETVVDKLNEKHGPLLGKTINFTIDRGTGYETQHTGKVLEWGDKQHLYIRDSFNDRIYQLDGHEIDKVYTGPTGLVNMYTFGAKEMRPHKGEMADFLSSILHGSYNGSVTELLQGLHEALPENAWTKDSLVRGQINTADFRSKMPVVREMTWNSPRKAANYISLAVDNYIRTLVGKEHSLNLKDSEVSLAPFAKAFDLDGALSNPKIDLFKKHIGVMLEMSKNKGVEWFNGKDYYPTDDWLRSKGIEEEYISTWRGIFDMLSDGWEKEVKALENNGYPIYDRIRGYIPDVFVGPYVIKAFRLNEKGDKVFVAKLNAFSRRHSDAQLKALQTRPEFGTEGIQFEQIDPSVSGRDVGGQMTAAREMQQSFGNSPGLKAIIDIMYDSATKGIITHVMERSNPPMMGHLLERTQWNDPYLGLSNKELRSAMDLFRRYSESVNGWLVRSEYVKNVLKPLDESGIFTKYHTLANRIELASKAFMKIPAVYEDIVNAAIRGDLIKYGWDPAIANSLSSGLTHGVSMYYLMFSPAFWIANIFQRVVNYPVLMAIHAQQGLMGAKQGSILKAFKDTQADFDSWKPLSIGNKSTLLSPLSEIARYAIEHGHTEPIFQDLIAPGKVKDKVSINIERSTRMSAFLTAYHYFKQIMSHEEALRAAGKHADTVGVPYQSQFGQPLWFKGMSTIEKPLSLFMSYQSHQFSTLNMMLSTIRQGVTTGVVNPLLAPVRSALDKPTKQITPVAGLKAAVTAAGAVAAWQLMQFGLFGTNGIIEMENVDYVLKAINKALDTEFRVPEDYSRELEKYYPEWMRGQTKGGLVSLGIGSALKVMGMDTKATAFDVSTSGSGANFSLPKVVLGTIDTAVAALMLAGKKLAYEKKWSDIPVTAQDTWKLSSTLSSRWQGLAEYMIKYGGDLKTMGKDIVSGDFPTNPVSQIHGIDTAATPNILIDQGYKRDKVESYMRLIFGLHSIDERAALQSERLTDTEKKNAAHVKEAVTQRIKENQNLTSRDLDTIIKYSVRWGDLDWPKQVATLMGEAQFRAGLSPTDRRAFDAKSDLERLIVMQKLLEERKLEPKRGR